MLNLIFDYDGTLHESAHIYASAFRIAYSYLVDNSIAPKREWTNAEISKWLGYSSKDMWNQFMPSLPQVLKDRCSKMIGDEMLCQIRDGKSRLYSGAEEVLEELKSSGYNLIFLSNCKHGYMQEHRKCFSLDKYFSHFYCTEDYGFAPKWEIFKSIKEDFQGEFIIIGDRFQDIEIATRHGLQSVGCTYGYGSTEELSGASALISNISDLPDSISSLKNKLK